MSMPAQGLADAFLELAAGAKGGPSDATSLLSTLAHRCPDLLGVRSATAVFQTNKAEPPLAVGSDPDVARLATEAADWGEGPGHDCRRTGTAVPHAALEGYAARQRWPRYAPRALDLGYASVTALPLRGGEEVVGALVLLCGRENPLTREALALGQSLADFSVLVLMREREVHESRTLAAQLEHALTSRLVIEQAKGLLAARHGLSMDEAFARLRRHARSRQRLLAEVARDVVEGRLRLGESAP